MLELLRRLIQRNIGIPDGFETTAKRTAREERQRIEGGKRAAQEAEQQLEWEYEDYLEREINRYIEANPTAFEAIKNAKWKEDREKFSFTTESMAKIAARFEIKKQLPLLTFDEFLDHKKQGTVPSLKQVAPPLAPEAETIATDAPLADASIPHESATNQKPPTVESESQSGKGEDKLPVVEPATNPATPELSPVELASDLADDSMPPSDPINPPLAG